MSSGGVPPGAGGVAPSGAGQATASPGKGGGGGGGEGGGAQRGDGSGVEGGALYRSLFTLILARLPPEGAHRLAALTLRVAVRTPGCASLLARRLGSREPVLERRALGLTFPSPLGVAAGVDKDGSWFEGLGCLGFGLRRRSARSRRAQDEQSQAARASPAPRDRALLTSMGFPNPGARALAARLERRRRRRPIVG